MNNHQAISIDIVLLADHLENIVRPFCRFEVSSSQQQMDRLYNLLIWIDSVEKLNFGQLGTLNH